MVETTRRGAGRRRRRGARPPAARRRAPPGRTDRVRRFRLAHPRPSCPRSCRQYARFAPNRRAKFAGQRHGRRRGDRPAFPASASPEKFKEAQPELAGALDPGSAPPAADPLDVAAAPYVLRPPGWGEAGDRRRMRSSGRTPSVPTRRTARSWSKLREELAEARGHTRPRPSGCARAGVGEDGGRVASPQAARRPVVTSSAARRRSASPGELTRCGPPRPTGKRCPPPRARRWRLKARPGEAEAALEASAARRGPRGRSVEDMRARLLLDTVLDAAARGRAASSALPPGVGAARRRQWTRSSPGTG